MPEFSSIDFLKMTKNRIYCQTDRFYFFYPHTKISCLIEIQKFIDFDDYIDQQQELNLSDRQRLRLHQAIFLNNTV